jgi:Uncharacterised nucleotidyltransferase
MVQRALRVLTPEQQVVLACARGRMTAEAALVIAQPAAQAIDWNAAKELADRHGVGYFFASHLLALAREGAAALPPSFERTLRTSRWGADVYGKLLSEQQRRLGEELDRAGISVLWLKGLALSMQLYGQAQARECGDLDLLCAASDIGAAEICLRRAGFRAALELSGKDDHPMAAHHRGWMTDAGQTTILVELHHRLTGPPACQPDVATLLTHARRVAVDGHAFPVPAPSHELLLLCLHAHHHNFAILRSLMDIAEYVANYQDELDWPQFFADARRFRAHGRTQAALTLASATLDLGAPREVLGATLGPLQRWSINNLTAATLLQVGMHEDDFRRARLGLLMDSWGNVVRLLGPHLWPTRNYLRAVCPAPLGSIPGLAHFYHFARIVGRWLREAGNRRTRGGEN